MEYVLISSTGDVHRITVTPAHHGEQGAYRLSDLAREGWSCPNCKEVLVLEQVVEIYAKDHLQEAAIETAYAYVGVASHAQNEYAEVAPGQLNFGPLGLAGSKTLHVLITNNRSQSLTWSADTGGADWLTLNQDSGAVEPYSQQTINVTAKAGSLNVGHHSATLNFILSNSVKVRISASVDVFKVQHIITSHIGPKVPTVNLQPSNLQLQKGQNTTFHVTVINPNTKAEMSPYTEVNWKVDTTRVPAWLTMTDTGTLKPSGETGDRVTIAVTVHTSSLIKGNQYKPTLSFTLSYNNAYVSKPTDVIVTIAVN